jgi:RNA polymerase sigma factor (sigma-70 family)
MTSDAELLARFARVRSEEAFTELLRRHVHLVYSAALRQVGGDANLAQDVAQTVFSDLARKASALAGRDSLTGWLYTSARFAAAKIMRAENRRRVREEQFMREAKEAAPETDWEQLRPVLDEVMHQLAETEREAILLRYFENRPFAEIGARYGLNENATRMRVERALEKLRGLLAKRGVTTAAALASVISAQAVQPAPATLAATLATSSLAGAGGGALAFWSIMNMTKLKLGLGAIVVLGASATLMVEHQAREKLRAENEDLTQQIARLKAENEAVSDRAAHAKEPSSLPNAQFRELIRLRGEVGLLRDRLAKLDSARTNGQAHLPQMTPLPATTNQPYYYAADTWTNVGFNSPHETSVSFLWALKQGNMGVYKAALPGAGNSIEQFPVEWADAFQNIEGSSISEVTQSPEGNPAVAIVHQFPDGKTENTWLQFKVVDGSWLISSLTGYPISVAYSAPKSSVAE